MLVRKLEDGSWSEGRRRHLSRLGPWPWRGLATPAVAEWRLPAACLHRNATGAVHSQSWKLQQPISRHYNNLHSVVMERSIQKKCSAGAQAAAPRKGLGRISELLCSSRSSSCRQAQCASMGGASSLGSACKLVLHLGEQGLEDSLAVNSAPHGVEGVGKGRTGDESWVPSPILSEGLWVESRTPLCSPLKKGGQK